MVLPDLPDRLLPNTPKFNPPSEQPPAFGRQCRKLFRFREGWTNLNQGSYGSTPNAVFDAFVEWNRICEESPDLFFKRQYQPAQNKIRAKLATILKSDTDDIVLVPNTSIGINCVIRSLTYQPNDTIVCFSTAYDAVERLLAWAKDAHDNVEIHPVPLAYPISDQDVLDTLRLHIEKLIKDGRNVKLCVFDAISSSPGVRLPWERIVAFLKEHSILSLVDGAHAIGQIPVDLKTAKPDFFVTNAHKWLFGHRGCAVMYVVKKHRVPYFPFDFHSQCKLETIIQSSPTNMSYLSRGTKFNPSNGFSTENQFVSAFEWQGTMDLSSNLSLDVAIAFREWLGGEEKIMKYNFDLAKFGGRKCAEILRTETMEVTDSARQTELVCSMVNVRLPISSDKVNGATVAEIKRALIEDHNTFMALFIHNNFIWIRISAQIYLEMADFEFAGNALKKVCDGINAA